MNELRTVLLAEDNAHDIELTLEAFTEHNLVNQVVVAHDGVEVLEYLRYQGNYRMRQKGAPAVILMDIKMPRMDGLETLQAIRSDPALKMIPVVMLSSSREEQDLIRSYELGVNAYVVKPVDFKEFIEAVKRVGAFWAIINQLPPIEI